MIALVFCGDLKYCPYIKRYIERLTALKAEFKVYFWNRGGYNLNLPDNYIYYDSYSSLKNSKISKLYDFFKFRKWLLNKLENDKIEKTIALSTLSALILGKFLYSKPKSYIFDIRDYSYEHISLIYKLEEKIIKNSFFTSISSKGFRNFLPKHEYVIAHNFNRLELYKDAKFIPTDGVINFVWNGLIRYFPYQAKYLDALKNDSRFQIIYHGDGPDLDVFKKYCTENNIKNVVFTGAYDNDDKAKLLAKANILNNAYGYLSRKDERKVENAVSNRFYDGINFHIPQVVEPFGFKREWLEKDGLGVSFIPDSSFANKLYDYYHSLKPEIFNNSCNKVLKEILVEDDEFVSKIDDFIKM